MPHQWHSWLDLFKIYASTLVRAATECVDSLVGWLVCVAQKFMRVPRNQLCAPIYHAHELQMNERKNVLYMRYVLSSDFWKC